ncbi:conserved hypothetical protein [Psychromonas ingrahamii 37]|uniref:Uncharacterized protein n=1 Tax=Psychromonas ingrahamii (strain DSM 17664 / CCUG 51855 / 37) TaxID=357804 RepID=A1SUC7_PSYIN|nr:hypothetical protein [Psychromonas ingrahamii]ABM03092.1 conserved hypothetical protein [Psychromonas ingrahamii 37]
MTTPIPRLLICIPIIHTQSDMGSLKQAEEDQPAVTQLWQEIEEKILGFELPFNKVRLYQDGLPVSDLATQIVKETAAQGSHNHKLLMLLIEKGATLMGTEDPSLLLEEYHFDKQLVKQEISKEDASTIKLAQSLLERRDRFIAERVNATLSFGEIGILFLGALHQPNKWLEKDIRIIQCG